MIKKKNIPGSNQRPSANQSTFDELVAEKDALLTKEVSEQIDRQVSGSGSHAVNRRVALAVLSMPFREMTEKILADRDLVIVFADAATRIRESAEKYHEIYDLMQKAHARILVAIGQRDDVPQIIASLEAENKRSLH